MQMEIDILRAALDIIKKDHGINLTALKNREKIVLIDALRGKYALSELFGKPSFSRSRYYFQKSLQRRKDKYASLKERMSEIHADSGQTYVYRRIKTELEKVNIHVSEKVVRRLMARHGIFVC